MLHRWSAWYLSLTVVMMLVSDVPSGYAGGIVPPIVQRTFRSAAWKACMCCGCVQEKHDMSAVSVRSMGCAHPDAG